MRSSVLLLAQYSEPKVVVEQHCVVIAGLEKRGENGQVRRGGDHAGGKEGGGWGPGGAVHGRRAAGDRGDGGDSPAGGVGGDDSAGGGGEPAGHAWWR